MKKLGHALRIVSDFVLLKRLRELSWQSRITGDECAYYTGYFLVAVLPCALILAVPVTITAFIGMALRDPTSTLSITQILMRPTLLACIVLGLLAIVYCLYALWMSIKITVLRFHDFNRSGWWYVLILLAMLGMSPLFSLGYEWLQKYGMYSFFLAHLETTFALVFSCALYYFYYFMKADKIQNRFGQQGKNRAQFTAPQKRFVYVAYAMCLADIVAILTEYFN